MSCDGGCISQSPSKGLGSRRSSEASSPTTQCRPTELRSKHSTTTLSVFGCARCGGVARRIASRGSGCTGWPPTGFPNRASFIRILTSVSPSHTQGGSRVRESRPHGSGVDLVLEQHAGEGDAGELGALIGVEDLGLAISGKSLLNRLETELLFQPV